MNKNLPFKIIAAVLLLFVSHEKIYAQHPVIVEYAKNEEAKNENPAISLIFYNNISFLIEKNAKTKNYIDYNLESIVHIINYNNKYYKTVEKFESLPQPTLSNDREDILGYNCKKAVFKAFSNTIEVWYTKKAKAKGSPYGSYLPQNALVLKIKINGNLRLIATQIKDFSKHNQLLYPLEDALEISKSRMRELQIKSRFTRLKVFDKQQINFDNNQTACNLDKVDTTFHCSMGSVILKKIKLPEIAKHGASVFATLTNWSNGDAYDRSGCIFTISDKKEKTVLDAFKNGLKEMPVFTANDGTTYQGIVSSAKYEVPVELMRFFTSFGVSHFNKKREINNYKWRDSVVYKQEITNLIPNDKDEIWLGVFIGNYDKGGHKVSLVLDVYPSWEEDKNPAKKYINPLFSTVNILEMSGQNYGRLFKTDTLTTSFDIPKDIKNLKLLYTSTGHGGWDGGDEFNQRLNKIFIDDKLVFNEVPWRTDCGTYRLSNPSSGNFKNGLSSSDLSRSNWCPATLTSPKVIPLDFLKPGKHTVKVVIDQGNDDKNSFNHWEVTGVLTGAINTNKKIK